MPVLPRNAALAMRVSAGLIFALSFNHGQIYAPAAHAETAINAAPAKEPSYSDLADLVTASPLIIVALPRQVKLLSQEQGGTPPTGYSRFLMKAGVTSLIRGESGIAPQIGFLVDLPDRDNGKPQKPRKEPLLLFARPGGRADMVQLVSLHAAQPATPALEERTRTIVAEVMKSDSPAPLAGVGEAFHFPGTVEGEGETQIFLKTVTGDPLTLSVTSTPGRERTWAVSTSEIVEKGSAAPPRPSLLWYRLACGLPQRLPAQSLRTLSFQNAEKVASDYAYILESLGSCGRTL